MKTRLFSSQLRAVGWVQAGGVQHRAAGSSTALQGGMSCEPRVAPEQAVPSPTTAQPLSTPEPSAGHTWALSTAGGPSSSKARGSPPSGDAQSAQ